MGTTAGQQPPAGSSAGSGQQQQDSPNAGAGGQPASSGSQPSRGGGDLSLPEWNREELNPLLRDMSPGQLNELFLSLLRGNTNGSRSESRERPQAEPKPQVNYKELFDPNSESYDPITAMKSFVEEQYGPLIGRTSSNALKGLYSNLRNRIHDFGDYEDEITQRLSERDPTTLTESDIFGTYLAMKGYRQFQSEVQQRKGKGNTTVPPTPRDDETPVDEPLTDKEKEVAKIMFPKDADPEARFRQERKKIGQGGYHEIKVPTGEVERSRA